MILEMIIIINGFLLWLAMLLKTLSHPTAFSATLTAILPLIGVILHRSVFRDDLNRTNKE